MLDNERTPMTRKDYVALAGGLAVARPNYDDEAITSTKDYLATMAARLQWEACVKAVGDVCMGDNPRFDRTRFVRACMAGVE